MERIIDVSGMTYKEIKEQFGEGDYSLEMKGGNLYLIRNGESENYDEWTDELWESTKVDE